MAGVAKRTVMRLFCEGGEVCTEYLLRIYNFIEIHRTLSVSHAMAAGVTDKLGQ